MSSPTHPDSRFQNVLNALDELKRRRPDLDPEIELAKGMIRGRRPGIEQKYDALLLKLDRTYSSMEDAKDDVKKRMEETKLHQERLWLKARLKALNRTLVDLTWMRARNRDMIRAAGRRPEQVQPVKCETCHGSGGIDSGGVTPWGAPITIPCPACDCKEAHD